ncbi:MAG: site-2 protease family protein, partial [Solirubrobacteraceae bacterium]
NQAVWKRVVVILAGPAVNIVLAFVIACEVLVSSGQQQVAPTRHVAQVIQSTPAASYLKPGDRIVSVDGVGGSVQTIRSQIESHRCPGAQVVGCSAATPARVTVRRDGQLRTFEIRPRYTQSPGTKARPELGFAFGSRVVGVVHPGVISAASTSGSWMWSVTTQTVSTIARIFEPQERRQLHGVVGVFAVTQESIQSSATTAFEMLALISLALGVINLFPFLPLDGGHIFWAVAEKIRGRRISFSVMERAGVVGFALIVLLFAVGLSNDISALSGSGFGLR